MLDRKKRHKWKLIGWRLSHVTLVGGIGVCRILESWETGVGKQSWYNSKELEETVLALNSSSSSPSAPYPPPLLKERCHMIIQLLYNVAQVGKSPNAVPNIKLSNVIIVYYYIAQFNEDVQKLKLNKQSLFSKYFCNGHFISSFEFRHPSSSSHIILFFNPVTVIKIKCVNLIWS